MERDDDQLVASEICEISTHTLTWSVTLDGLDVHCGVIDISTHTLTWSVTP